VLKCENVQRVMIEPVTVNPPSHRSR